MLSVNQPIYFFSKMEGKMAVIRRGYQLLSNDIVEIIKKFMRSNGPFFARAFSTDAIDQSETYTRLSIPYTIYIYLFTR